MLFSTQVEWTGLRVFSATKVRDREALGETVSRWLAQHKGLEIADKVVLQSSDSEYHCLSIVLFFRSLP